MKLTIGKKIALGYAILLGLLVIMSSIAYISFKNINHYIHETKDSFKNTVFFLNKEIDHLNWIKGLSSAMLANEEITVQTDHTKCALGKWLYSEDIKKIDSPEILKILEEIKEPHERLHISSINITHLIKNEDKEAAFAIYKEKTMPALNEVKIKLDKINEIYQNKTEKDLNEMDKNVDRGEYIILILSIVNLIIGVILSIFIITGLMKTLNAIIKNLSQSSESVSSASAQLSASSQQLAEGSTEQAASIEETSATLEESSSMVRQNTENTKQAAILAKQAKDSANKGNHDMQQMMDSMENLKKSSDQIAKIIKVIDEIAFQTNILALNAAVEAARAGEAGLGFAVVAEEVRNLAQRSAQAAKDTAIIIESNINLSQEGVYVSKKVNESLSEINNQAQKVSELLDEISAASQEQAQGIAQINKAISQMEQVVQSNAATAEESASSSEELNIQSGQMKEIISSLIILVNGVNSLQQQASAVLTDNSSSVKSLPKTNRKFITGTTSNNLNKRTTKIINPEDVIPLEQDNSGF